jgi:ABC-2 type transport system ATP-binding protein
MRSLAAQGRTVLLSSHLMSEMALTADQVVVIGRGKLITETSMTELMARFRRDVVVRSADDPRLAAALRADGAQVAAEAVDADGGLAVAGVDAVAIGELALRQGIAVHELTPRTASLEDVYLELTEDSVEYRALERSAG